MKGVLVTLHFLKQQRFVSWTLSTAKHRAPGGETLQTLQAEPGVRCPEAAVQTRHIPDVGTPDFHMELGRKNTTRAALERKW